MGVGEEGRIHSADVCWDLGGEQEDCACITVFITTNLLHYNVYVNTLRTGLLNCLNARSRGLTFRQRASCI